ncbi:hypothetical protein [Actinoplanes sp. NPDC023714]|uniref:hypothetical protein n=1 Tax=Actinoplanes sp. NPDC023714 TaxID=3154322 RepID=UPI0033F1DCC0
MPVGFDLWGQRGAATVEVVGEPLDAGVLHDFTVSLAPDPREVGVWAGTRRVGALSTADAARYAPVLARLVAGGWEPRVTALVGASSIHLDLAEPHLLVPANAPPAGPHLMLPPGAAVPVLGDRDALTPWLRPEGACWVHATLHSAPHTPIAVRVDGVRVGELTPEAGAGLLPVVDLLAEGGLISGVRAIVAGDHLTAGVVLYAARAHELPESWIADAHVHAVKVASGAADEPAPTPRAVISAPVVSSPGVSSPVGAGAGRPPASAPVSIPPEPTGVTFVVPPTWPTPPPGWKPPPGWRPDPSWPAPPYGWRWWIPTWD